ncbi:ribonuclease III [Candidatus Berkelbacteria bacterium]|nr:ribonuclease III [Candidatus Berkelbacteria bacterium]
MNKKLSDFEKQLGVTFKHKKLLEQVFIHRSYLNEHHHFPLDHNERLEFLGDAVLELIVTEYLYLNYKNPEGELTNWRSALVKGAMLAKVAKTLGMGEYLQMSKGEERSGGRDRDALLANAFEALIGAIYLEGGYKQTQKFVSRVLLVNFSEILEKKLYQDAKSKLQEWSQEKYGITPIYRVVSESGPDHAKEFTVSLIVGEQTIAQGGGSSKQKAEEAAARAAIEKLKLN